MTLAFCFDNIVFQALMVCFYFPIPIPIQMATNVQKCLHCSCADSYSDSNGHCTKFNTYIATDKVVLKKFSL